MAESKLGYLVEVFVVQASCENDVANSDYPPTEFPYVIKGNDALCIPVSPVLVDEIIRDQETDADISIGQVRQSPWKLNEGVVMKLLEILSKERSDVYQKTTARND